MSKMAIDWRSCYSMSEDHELLKMEEWCQGLYAGKELDILEIGSYQGKTTALLAQFGFVVCIDLWAEILDGEKDYDHIGTINWPEFLYNMKRLKLINHRVFPVISSSTFADFLMDQFYDVVFIDGCHKYEAVKKDLNQTCNLVRPGGIIILHDYKRPGWGYPPYDRNKDHDPWWEVAKAVDEFLMKPEWSIKEHYAGIVALEWK